MRDAKPNNEKGPTKTPTAERAAGVRRPNAARMPGASVHASLASEIGLRIVRGDYPPATNLQERTGADTRFHLAILRASGNDLLVPLGVLIESAFDHLFTYTTRELDDLHHAQKLHEAIEKNIRLQRPDAARNAVRKLLANTDGVIRAR